MTRAGSNPAIPTKTFKGCWQQDCQCDIDVKSCSGMQFLMESLMGLRVYHKPDRSIRTGSD